MFAGARNKRVRFERASETTDGGGGTSVSWTEIVTVWGGFTPERGRERLEAGRLEAAAAGTLNVRSSSDTRGVTEADRVKIDDVPYQIMAIINPDQENEELEMTVQRGVAT